MKPASPKLLMKPRLVLHVPSASADQLRRGLDAAKAYFKSVGVNAGEARNALTKIDDEDIGVPGIVISERESSIWHHWTEAQRVAIESCCGDQSVPPRSWLEYRIHDERDARRWSREYAAYLGRPAPLTRAEVARLLNG
jgi:hypothetical protein